MILILKEFKAYSTKIIDRHLSILMNVKKSFNMLPVVAKRWIDLLLSSLCTTRHVLIKSYGIWRSQQIIYRLLFTILTSTSKILKNNKKKNHNWIQYVDLCIRNNFLPYITSNFVQLTLK